jgi:hypothetical protein
MTPVRTTARHDIEEAVDGRMAAGAEAMGVERWGPDALGTPARGVGRARG